MNGNCRSCDREAECAYEYKPCDCCDYRKFKPHVASAGANEPILDDNYPVYWGYWYIMDGVPKRSEVEGNVATIKGWHQVKEVRRCDAVKRKLPLI